MSTNKENDVMMADMAQLVFTVVNSSGLPPADVMTALTLASALPIASLELRPGKTDAQVVEVLAKGVTEFLSELRPAYEEARKAAAEAQSKEPTSQYEDTLLHQATMATKH